MAPVSVLRRLLEEKNSPFENKFEVRTIPDYCLSASILRKAHSTGFIKCNVKFDPQVWGHRCEALEQLPFINFWYSQTEIHIFELETINCIREYALNKPGCQITQS